MRKLKPAAFTAAASAKQVRAPSARAVALKALLNGGSQSALDAALRSQAGVSAADRALATALVYGTMKMQRALAWSLAHYLKRPLRGLSPPLRWSLLLGAYQLLYMDRIPVHSAVDESVTLARGTGHAGTAAVANAVLRKLAASKVTPPDPRASDPPAVFADHASLPDWLAQHILGRFGLKDAMRIARGVNGPAARAARVNTARTDLSSMTSQLANSHLSPQQPRYQIPECLAFGRGSPVWPQTIDDTVRAGLLTVQSEESQLACHLLDVKAGETVIDACAGRGVKTGALAQRLTADSNSAIYAIDDDAKKLRLLALEMERLGVRGVRALQCDARRPFPPAVPLADAALVDAPCTGIGIIGRHPELRWRKRPDDGVRLSATQLAILECAAERSAGNGRILYVTCSTDAREDEDVVRSFLARNEGWRSAPLQVPANSADMLPIGDFLLTLPGVDGADGFFFAQLVRRAPH
ncbi:MAG: hypothetical protein DLM53_00970 [Candidatus Eremiobacter antarcticus]|nr:hypothetical protein [Candidatus Eremiobacteraeota bacterium]MBC5808628.1 hypothetical protein [Candidatus Eremiobacteraeota bacterium]PZR64327.1 MAG: hypothetical protein DLM53_00970 [Candidatus Eremiobacter sp. RRmetagenome_bin22]